MSAGQERAEVLVIGAGPGGSAAAARLAQAGHDVLLVDRADFPRDKTCGDGLTPRCVAALEALGALRDVLEAGAERISGARLVGPHGESCALDFHEFLTREPPYGLVLERYTLDDVLRQYAVRTGARYLGNVKIDGFTLDGDRITEAHGTHNGDPITLRPQGVVLATGASHPLLRTLGVLEKMPTAVRAVRAYYEGVPNAPPLFDFYFETYMLPGYGWVFPVGGDRVNAGIGLWPGLAAWLYSEKPPLPRLLDRFIREQSAGDGQARWRQVGPVKGYPIRTDYPSHRVAGANWVLIGESAGLVNPATGEGIDLAVESGLLAADVLSPGLKKGRWRGAAYARRLWLRNAPSQSGTRVYAYIVINPVMMDYVIWQMKLHRFLAKATMRLAMGIGQPWEVLHPLFLLQLFLPLPTPF